MSKFKFLPEGWNSELSNIIDMKKEGNLEKIYQGVVERCDKDYNLHVNLGNKLIGKVCSRRSSKISKKGLKCWRQSKWYS